MRFGQNVLSMTWKERFVQIFMEGGLFSGFEENFRPLWRFQELSHSKLRLRQNVLPMTWKDRFVKFSWKACCFPVLARISGQCDDFESFDA